MDTCFAEAYEVDNTYEPSKFLSETQIGIESIGTLSFLNKHEAHRFLRATDLQQL